MEKQLPNTKPYRVFAIGLFSKPTNSNIWIGSTSVPNHCRERWDISLMV